MIRVIVASPFRLSRSPLENYSAVFFIASRIAVELDISVDAAQRCRRGSRNARHLLMPFAGSFHSAKSP